MCSWGAPVFPLIIPRSRSSLPHLVCIMATGVLLWLVQVISLGVGISENLALTMRRSARSSRREYDGLPRNVCRSQ